MNQCLKCKGSDRNQLKTGNNKLINEIKIYAIYIGAYPYL